MVSLDSACLITLISTLKLLFNCLKPLKPIISGLNRKCVGGSQNGHQNPVQRHRFTLEKCLTIHYYSLKPLKPTFFWKTGDFRSLPVIGHGRGPAHDTSQSFDYVLQPEFWSILYPSFAPIAAMWDTLCKKNPSIFLFRGSGSLAIKWMNTMPRPSLTRRLFG